MMEYTERINEIKTFKGKRRTMKVCLNDMHIPGLFCVATSNLDCRAKVKRPDFRTILSCIISKATVSAAGIHHSLAQKKLRAMRLHIAREALIPLLIHLRESLPFEPEAESSCYLACIVSRRGPIPQERITQR